MADNPDIPITFDGIVRPYSLRITVPAESEASARALSKLVGVPRRCWSMASATIEPDYLVLMILLEETPSIEEQVDAVEKDLVALGLPARSEWSP